MRLAHSNGRPGALPLPQSREITKRGNASRSKPFQPERRANFVTLMHGFVIHDLRFAFSNTASCRAVAARRMLLPSTVISTGLVKKISYRALRLRVCAKVSLNA